MFSGRHLAVTVFIILGCGVGAPIIVVADGGTIMEAIYLGLPIGLSAGVLSAAAQWRIETLRERDDPSKNQR